MARGTLLAALMLIALPVIAALPGAAHPEGGSPALIDIHKEIDGADTYMIALRSTEGFNVLNNSHVIVTGTFGFNETRQDVGAMIGTVRYIQDGSCNACLVGMVGDSIKDESDLRVRTDGPLSYTYEQDPDAAAHASLAVGRTFPSLTHFEGPLGGAEQVTYRFFVTIPGARSIHVNLHLHLNKEVQVLGEAWHDGGFLRAGEDFQPAAEADTVAANAMVQGETIVPFDRDPGEHLYAFESASWFGNTVISSFGNGAAFATNTLAAGSYGVEVPSGNSWGMTTVVAGSGSGPVLLGFEQSGDYRFWVDAQAGLGPSAMYVVGMQGPVA